MPICLLFDISFNMVAMYVCIWWLLARETVTYNYIYDTFCHIVPKITCALADIICRCLIGYISILTTYACANYSYIYRFSEVIMANIATQRNLHSAIYTSLMQPNYFMYGTIY